MPPTTSQDDKVTAVAKAKSLNNEYCFMSSSFRKNNANGLPLCVGWLHDPGRGRIFLIIGLSTNTLFYY
jgi:hypothetical protein